MDQNKNIFDTPLDYLIGDRFGRYAKYIIQERALPDVRDGLKPVQRRIIYAMLVNGNIPSKPYRKSATAAGFVMGHYHPHGDSSIYEAMVRMSQWWKSNKPLIDMQGNNGSLDDDPPAAMRYTEARLSNISMDLLKDIEKDTVAFAPNYDDSTTEPTVLPSKFPNLLVNGAEGIAAGYSTSIPPHNFNEVNNAVIYRIKNPKCSLDELMEILPGPDFPTGGIIRGKEGLKECLETGGGQVQLEAKYEVVEQKNCNAMIITEIPFGVVKKELVYSIDKIRLEKEIDGIIEARDESDREGLRIVVEIKKEADKNAVISYLMKKTKLSIKYTYNVIAICDKKPIKLGVLPILDYYIKHEVEVINRRTAFDLNKTRIRLHTLEGMVKVLSDIPLFIEIITTSDSKEQIKVRTCEKFSVDMDQAEAVVTIQVYRLNRVDIGATIAECQELKKQEEHLLSILDNERKIKTIICKELEELNKKYVSPRLSMIEDEVNEYVIENKPIIKEDVMYTVTRDGYFKRTSLKSYNSSDIKIPNIKADDAFVGIGQANTSDFLLCFTDKGTYLYVPIHELSETKWKDEGKHINTLITLNGDEKIIKVIAINDFKEDAYVIIATKNGLIKRTKLSEFVPTRYSKPLQCTKLSDDDFVVGVDVSDGDSICCLFSRNGRSVQYHESKISIIGIRAAGVKSMNVKDDDYVNGLIVLNKDEKYDVAVFTDKGAIKIYNPRSSIELSQRMSRTHEIYKFYRTEPQYLIGAVKLTDNCDIYTLSNIELKHRDIDDKPTTIGKSVRNSIFEVNGEKMVFVTDIKVKFIDSSFKTYESISEANEEIIVDLKEDNKTIFDYLDDIENED